MNSWRAADTRTRISAVAGIAGFVLMSASIALVYRHPDWAFLVGYAVVFTVVMAVARAWPVRRSGRREMARRAVSAGHGTLAGILLVASLFVVVWLVGRQWPQLAGIAGGMYAIGGARSSSGSD